MKDFKYLNYNTEYSSTGDVEIGMGSRACFGYIFNNIPRGNSSVEYDIKVYKDQRASNLCLLTLKEIKAHLNKLKTFGTITYKIEEEVQYYTVYLNIKDSPGILHKYALTWVRYLYEFPFNVALYDTFKFKKEPLFKFTSYSNLFNLILGCNPDNQRGIHQVPNHRAVEFKTIPEIKKRLKDIQRLNDLYKGIKDRIDTIPEQAKNYSIYDLEYWLDEEIYENVRKPVYLNNFKNIKR